MAQVVRRMAVSTLFFVVMLTIGLLGILVWFARLQATSLVYPADFPSTGTPQAVGITDYETVQLTTSDGVTLAAWYVPPPVAGGGGVVYAHGIASQKDHWLPEMRVLHNAGYGALMLDFRNHGDSGGDVTTLGALEVTDIQAGYDYLVGREEIDSSRIVLVGDSFGASVSLLAAAQLPEVRGVVAVSPYSSPLGVIGDRAQTDFRLPARPTADLVLWWANRMSGADFYSADVVAAAAQVAPRPMWLVHGSVDRTTPPTSTERIAAAAGDAAEVWIVEGSGHGMMRATHAAEFQSRLLEFVEAVTAS